MDLERIGLALNEYDESFPADSVEEKFFSFLQLQSRDPFPVFLVDSVELELLGLAEGENLIRKLDMLIVQRDILGVGVVGLEFEREFIDEVDLVVGLADLEVDLENLETRYKKNLELGEVLIEPELEIQNRLVLWWVDLEAEIVGGDAKAELRLLIDFEEGPPPREVVQAVL